MKKLISLITIIALLLAALSLFASCGSKAMASVGPEIKGNITWSYDSDTKTLKIVGDNNAPVEMEAFTAAGAPWYAYRTAVARLEITGVAKISDYAFYSMYYIKEISLGSSVTEIGKCAFAFCSSIAELDIPSTVTKIGESAFEGCASLKSVKLPESLTAIEARAFAYDHALTEVTIPEALTKTYDQASVFEGIENLPKINVIATAAPAPEGGEATEAPAETEAPTETEAPAATEAPADTEAPAETEAAATNDVGSIIAVIVLALVVIGLIVGGILLMRSNNKQTKDSRTVRKNDNAKNTKGKKK